MHFNVKLLVQHLCSSLVYSSGNFGQKMWARKEKKYDRDYIAHVDMGTNHSGKDVYAALQ